MSRGSLWAQSPPWATGHAFRPSWMPSCSNTPRSLEAQDSGESVGYFWRGVRERAVAGVEVGGETDHRFFCRMYFVSFFLTIRRVVCGERRDDNSLFLATAEFARGSGMWRCFFFLRLGFGTRAAVSSRLLCKAARVCFFVSWW